MLECTQDKAHNMITGSGMLERKDKEGQTLARKTCGYVTQ